MTQCSPRLIFVLFLALSCLHIVSAASSCPEQFKCVAVSFNTVEVEGFCEFEACLKVSSNSECTQTNLLVEIPPEGGCPPPAPNRKGMHTLDASIEKCQRGGLGATLKFAMQDELVDCTGVASKAGPDISLGLITGSNLECAAEDKIAFCTINKECIWTVTLPAECPGFSLSPILSPSPSPGCTGDFKAGPATQVTSLSDAARQALLASFGQTRTCAEEKQTLHYTIVGSKEAPYVWSDTGVTLTVESWGSSSKYAVGSVFDPIQASFQILGIPEPTGLPGTSAIAFLLNVDRMDANAALTPNNESMKFKFSIPPNKKLRVFLYKSGVWSEITVTDSFFTLPHTSPVAGYTVATTTTASSSDSALYGLLALIAIPVLCLLCLLIGAIMHWKDPTLFSRGFDQDILQVDVNTPAQPYTFRPQTTYMVQHFPSPYLLQPNVPNTPVLLSRTPSAF